MVDDGRLFREAMVWIQWKLKRQRRMERWTTQTLIARFLQGNQPYVFWYQQEVRGLQLQYLKMEYRPDD